MHQHQNYLNHKICIHPLQVPYTWTWTWLHFTKVSAPVHWRYLIDDFNIMQQSRGMLAIAKLLVRYCTHCMLIYACLLWPRTTNLSYCISLRCCTDADRGVQTTASSVRTIEQTRQDDSRGRSTDNDRIRRWRHSSLTWASSTRRHVIMSTIGVDSALARPSVMSKVSTAHKMATTGGNMPEWMRRRRGTIWHHESRETDIAVAHRARHSDVRPLTSQTRVQPFAVLAARRREVLAN